MSKKRNQHSSSKKAKVVVEALRERKTNSEIAGSYQVHVSQVTRWKREAMSRLPELFELDSRKGQWVDVDLVPSLYQQIGQLSMELDWLKKKIERGLE